MPVLTVTVNVSENPWRDLVAKRGEGKLITAMSTEAGRIRVGGLPEGMESGRTSVSFAIPLPDGTVLLTETSLALFLEAADILRAAYPNG